MKHLIDIPPPTLTPGYVFQLQKEAKHSLSVLGENKLATYIVVKMVLVRGECSLDVSFVCLFPCGICSVVSAVVQQQGARCTEVIPVMTLVCVMERWLSYFRPREASKAIARLDTCTDPTREGCDKESLVA